VKQTPTISISNIPGVAVFGGSFTPTFAYTGNGTTHVNSGTTAICRVIAGVVRFVGVGTCTLTARASMTSLYDRAVGSPQSFAIAQATPTVSIKNIPVGATYGGFFRPAYDKDGHGGASTTSSTPLVCAVEGARVDFVSVGTCTLTAAIAATANYTAATGVAQSFAVGQATPTIAITRIPETPKVGNSFVPRFNYAGDGVTSVTSSTPAVCGVAGTTVNFLAAGTCALTPHATATTNVAAATGSPVSFLVKVTRYSGG
jgi:hypothetical protein